MQDTCKYQILYETCGFSYTGLFLETLYPRSCLQARQTRIARTIMNIKNNSEAYTTEKKTERNFSHLPPEILNVNCVLCDENRLVSVKALCFFRVEWNCVFKFLLRSESQCFFFF